MIRQLLENLHKIIKRFVTLNAIGTLSLMQKTLEVNISDKSFYVDTCIKGAKLSLIKGDDLEMAKIRFIEAYKIIFPHHSVSTSRINKL